MTLKTSTGRWFAAIFSDYKPLEYWDRDAGLYYKGFKTNGFDTKLVSIGKPSADQPSDLVLASVQDFESPSWWRQWNLEGVVAYTWAKPQLSGVARALREANVTTVLSLDGDGLVEAGQWFWRYYRIKWGYAKMYRKPLAPLYAMAQTLASGIKSRHTGMLDHLALMDCLAAQSPLAIERFSRFFMAHGRHDLLNKLRLLEHPINIEMRHDPAIKKEPLIVSVGAWDRFVKGAPLLIEALGKALARRADYRARVIGPGAEHVHRLASSLPDEIRRRIEVTGPLKNTEIVGHYQRARIFVNTSYSEGFNLSSGEALCCGCSVVGLAHMSCMNYYCSANSGTMATIRTSPFFSDALCAEIAAWERGDRDPGDISKTWTARLHYDGIARRAVELGRSARAGIRPGAS